MILKASYCSYDLIFKRPSGTSRGVLKTKETWFIKLEEGNRWGIGECGILRGLSYDDVPNYEEKIKWACQHIHLGKESLIEELKLYPSIVFGLEQAFRSLESRDPFLLYDSEFTKSESPIKINGLIWMGSIDFMKKQIDQKLHDGISCIKIKVGALDFERELELVKYLREQSLSVEIRLDANGGFDPQNALERLKRLSEYQIHSIEQPLKPEFKEELALLSKLSPIPIALDESLIGVLDHKEQEELLASIKPQYIILKPSFLGGFNASSKWIQLAESMNIGWWITSALESNIGLNAIAQWTSTLNSTLPQGLGTGALYTNNIESPLLIDKDLLYYRKSLYWDMDKIEGLCI